MEPGAGTAFRPDGACRDATQAKATTSPGRQASIGQRAEVEVSEGEARAQGALPVPERQKDDVLLPLVARHLAQGARRGRSFDRTRAWNDPATTVTSWRRARKVVICGTTKAPPSPPAGSPDGHNMRARPGSTDPSL